MDNGNTLMTNFKVYLELININFLGKIGQISQPFM